MAIAIAIAIVGASCALLRVGRTRRDAIVIATGGTFAASALAWLVLVAWEAYAAAGLHDLLPAARAVARSGLVAAEIWGSSAIALGSALAMTVAALALARWARAGESRGSLQLAALVIVVALAVIGLPFMVSERELAYELWDAKQWSGVIAVAAVAIAVSGARRPENVGTALAALGCAAVASHGFAHAQVVGLVFGPLCGDFRPWWERLTSTWMAVHTHIALSWVTAAPAAPVVAVLLWRARAHVRVGAIATALPLIAIASIPLDLFDRASTVIVEDASPRGIPEELEPIEMSWAAERDLVADAFLTANGTLTTMTPGAAPQTIAVDRRLRARDLAAVLGEVRDQPVCVLGVRRPPAEAPRHPALRYLGASTICMRFDRAPDDADVFRVQGPEDLPRLRAWAEARAHAESVVISVPPDLPAAGVTSAAMLLWQPWVRVEDR